MSTKVKTISLSLVTNDVTNSVKSFQFSKRYVKRLLKIGTLNIIYQRIDIPEPEFESKEYENVQYVVFQRKSTNKFIRNYHVFIHAILDALEKDYLKEIFMYILDKNTDDILETYNFKVKYNKDAAAESNMKPREVRNATVEFLQGLTYIPGEKYHSDNVELFMEFKYNDDAPRNYEPPNFEPAKEPRCVSLCTSKVFQIGSVDTGFHKVSAYGRGKNFILSHASTPAESVYLEEDSLELNIINDQENQEQRGLKRKHDVEIQNKQLNVNEARNESPFMDVTNKSNCDNNTIASSEEYISCLCKWDLPKEFETSRCTKCYGIVHLVCHGYVTLNAVDEGNFRCYTCADPKANTSKMNRLIKLRIILYGIYLKKELPIELELASKDERKYILGQLDKLGVYSSNAKYREDVNVKKLHEALLTIFATENSQYLE